MFITVRMYTCRKTRLSDKLFYLKRSIKYKQQKDNDKRLCFILLRGAGLKAGWKAGCRVGVGSGLTIGSGAAMTSGSMGLFHLSYQLLLR